MKRFGLDLDDPANRALVDETHPGDWKNPDPASRYDLVVIGGGTAGLVAAIGGAGLGARVALVERSLLGGDCLNWGCVPSKALLAAADAWHAARSGALGAPVAGGDGDFSRVMASVRTARARIAPNDGAKRLQSLGVDVFFGNAEFDSSSSIEVRGASLRFRRAVIATGARPSVPEIPGFDVNRIFTNESIFEIHERPEDLVIIGGGPIGCELAQAFVRLGSRVTIVERGARILAHDEPDAAAIVEAALRLDGVTILLRSSVTRVVDGSEGRQAVEIVSEDEPNARTVRMTHLLAATGRTPNIESLRLDQAEIETDEEGLLVDDLLRTTNRRVFAAGDVAGRMKFTHLADAHSRIVLTNALFPARRRSSRLVVPRCTYTSPELAQTGMTREEAAKQGIDVDETRVDFEDTDRAIVDGAHKGFLRIITRRGSGDIVGATVVGEGAGELISTLTLAISNGISMNDLASLIVPYPTRSEAIRKAADAWRRTRLTPNIRRLLDGWMALRRRI